MAVVTERTGSRHEAVTAEEHAALMRLFKVANTDTGQARRAADFLLAWWNPVRHGKFDFIDLWSVDQQIEDDVITVLRLALRSRSYPDVLGYARPFEEVVRTWR